MRSFGSIEFLCKGVDDMSNSKKITEIVFRFILMVVLSFYITVFLDNSNLEFQSGIFIINNDLSFLVRLFSVSVVISIMIFALLLLNNYWLSISISIFIFLCLGFANFQKKSFQNTPLFPSDFSQITGVNDMLGMIDESIIIKVVVGLTIYVIMTIVLIRLYAKRHQGMSFINKTRINYVLRGFTMILITGSLLYLSRINISGNKTILLYRKMAFEQFRWDQDRVYNTNGFVSSFISNFSGPPVSKPSNYSKLEIENVYDKYNKKMLEINESRMREDLKDVSIIYILSESLADPRYYDEIKLDSDPLEYILDPSDKALVGTLISPAYGGGTPNTEFEILTGISIQYLEPNMKLPFQDFLANFSSFPSVVSYLKGSNESIKTYGIHSYSSKMYKRRAVYRALGFDTALFSDDLEPNYAIDNNPYISDAATYENIIDILESSDEDVFMNVVTMQNHGGYTDIYNQYDTRVLDDSLDQQLLLDLMYYMQGIKYTDEATMDFMSMLESMDRDVIVVFYGDHQPGIYSSLERDVKSLDRFKTDFFIYSNFETKDRVAYDQEYYSLTQMNDLVFELTDLKLNTLQTFFREYRDEFLFEKNGVFYLRNGDVVEESGLSEQQLQLVRDYQMILYDILIGDKVFYENK